MASKGSAGGILAGLFALLLAAGATGLARGLSKATSKLFKESGEEVLSIRPSTITDQFDTSRSIRQQPLASHATDDFLRIKSASEEIEELTRPKVSSHKDPETLFNNSGINQNISTVLSDILSGAASDLLQTLFEDTVIDVNSISNKDNTSLKSELDRYVLSDEFLFRFSSLLKEDRFQDAALAQDYVVRILAKLSLYGDEYGHALSLSLTNKTWTSLLVNRPHDVQKTCNLLFSLPSRFVAPSYRKTATLNCAHADLLLGNATRAKEVYITLLHDRSDGIDWATIIHDDYSTMLRAGISSSKISIILEFAAHPSVK